MRKKKRSFFHGVLLSALNFFPIPYYVFVSVALSSYGWFSFEKNEVIAFVIGAGLGSFVIFYLYIAFFKKMEKQSVFILANMNYIIGTITGIITLISLVNVVSYYLQ